MDIVCLCVCVCFTVLKTVGLCVTMQTLYIGIPIDSKYVKTETERLVQLKKFVILLQF